MTKYLKTKEGSIEDVAKQLQNKVMENDYQDKFKKALDKEGKPIGQMTGAEKKAFFNKVDKMHSAKNEETISERGGANTSSKQGSFAKSRKPKYRFGYRVAEKQPKGNDIEETFSQQQIKQAYGILNDPRYKQGNYSGAVAAIEKLAKGLSKHPDVANALKRANESVEHDNAFAISGVETQRPTEDLQEGKWSVEGITGYKDVSGQDRFKMIISATSKQDAERKWEKELDKHRAKRHIGPRGGGSCEDMDDIDIQPYTGRDSVGDIESSMTHSYDPSYGVKKETIDAGEVSKMKDKKKEVKFSTANVSTTEDKKDPKKEVIGSEKPEPTANLENTEVDKSYLIPDQETIDIVFQLVKNEGLFLGGSSGINVAAAIRLARELGPGHTIVTILCDSGSRYLSRLFNFDYLTSKDLEVPDWLNSKKIL